MKMEIKEKKEKSLKKKIIKQLLPNNESPPELVGKWIKVTILI